MWTRVRIEGDVSRHRRVRDGEGCVELLACGEGGVNIRGREEGCGDMGVRTMY